MTYFIGVLGLFICSSAWCGYTVDNCALTAHETLISTSPVSRIEGNCIVDGQIFPFNDKLFALHINGPSGLAVRYCQKATYTTPTGKACDRVVYKILWKNPNPPAECGGTPSSAEEPVRRGCSS